MRRGRRRVLDVDSLGYRCEPTGWTIETLRQYLNLRIDELDHRIGQRFDSMDRAIALAYQELSRWQTNTNEWRGAMTDRESTFMPRVETEQRLAAVESRVDELTARGSESEGRLRTVPWLLAAAGVVIAVVAVIVNMRGG